MNLRPNRTLLTAVGCVLLVTAFLFYVRYRHIGAYVSEANAAEVITLSSNGRYALEFDPRASILVRAEGPYKIEGATLLIAGRDTDLYPTRPGPQYSTFGTFSGGTITAPNGQHWKRR